MAAVMAPVRSSSFLPAIKCSDCSAEIEISRMGDHVCSEATVPPLPASAFEPLDLPFLPSNARLTSATNLPSKSAQPPRANTPILTTKAPLLPSDWLPAKASTNSSRILSQHSFPSGRQSPFEIPAQNTTPESSLLPSSGVSLSQECAFPPFPTSKSRSTTPTTPAEITQPFATHQTSQQVPGDSYSRFTPLSAQGKDGSVLQRMDTSVIENVVFRPKGHQKTPTMGSSKDFTYQPSAESRKANNSRPSTAGSGASRKPSLSSISRGPRSNLIDTNKDIPKIPNKLGNPTRSYTTGDIEEDKSGDLVQRKLSIEKLRHESRSRTYPVGNPNREESGARRPSAPSLHVTRPSVAAAIRPLHEIGSVSSFKSSRSLKGRPRSQVALIVSGSAAVSADNGTEDNQTIDNGSKAPAAPASNLTSDYRIENPFHTPAESTSSSASSESGAASASSTSTPSLSGSPQRQKRRPSNVGQNVFMQDFHFGINPRPDMEEPTSPRDTSPTNSNTSDLPASAKSGASTPQSIVDPAIHSGRSSLVERSDDGVASLPMPLSNLAAPSGLVPPPSSTRAPRTPKSVPVNKGRCRGCGERIVGKSVSSADGRLTGRYHKGCFICMTCKEPFRTADFYIHGNHPYCQRHYHELNKSLCTACDCGIEGQYVETENGRKYHQDCFTCQECKHVLRDHYFEINSEAYCDQHAVGPTRPQPQHPELPSQRRGTDIGPRPPAERRQTRLLMMTT